MVHWRELILGFMLATVLGFVYNIVSTTMGATPNITTKECVRAPPETKIIVQNYTTYEIKTEVVVKEVCASQKENQYLGFVKPETQEAISKSSILKYYQDTPMNLEPLEPKITGPRENAVPLKSLVVVAAGIGSEPWIDKLISLFGMKNFTFMLLLYHPLGLSKFLEQSWFDQVFVVSYPGQMKWWYIKRFVTPIVAKSFEYIFVFDDDVEFDSNSFKPLEYIELLRKFNIHLSQPSHVPGSPGALHKSTHQRENHVNGHWNDMVECGPGTVFSSLIWQTCIWDLIQEDLSSGYGIDLMWHNYCQKLYGFNTTAIIDKYPMKHGNRRTSYENGKKYDPHQEWTAYRQRFGHVVPESQHMFQNIGGPNF